MMNVHIRVSVTQSLRVSLSASDVPEACPCVPVCLNKCVYPCVSVFSSLSCLSPHSPLSPLPRISHHVLSISISISTPIISLCFYF